MKAQTLKIVVAAIALSFISSSGFAMSKTSLELKQLIKDSTKQEQALIEGMDELLKNAEVQNPNSKGVVEFLEIEMGWESPAEIVDNRVPNNTLTK